MEVITKKTDDIICIKPLIDSLNADTYEQFKNKIFEIVDSGFKFIILDMVAINFIGSKGIGAIIAVLKKVQALNGQISLCNVKTPVLNVFKITRLDSIFRIKDSENDSLNFLLECSKKN